MRIGALDKKRFSALVHQSRTPAAAYVSEEQSWWAVPDESVIGVVILDAVDFDYVGITLGRDEVGRYRAFDISECFVSAKEAECWLHRAMKWHARDGQKIFPQGDTGKTIDFFSQIVADEKLHPHFALIRGSKAHLPAREIINQMAPHFRDIDGNFVEQFQTEGFDARLWELYLNAYLVEEELFINRDYNAPDFIVKKYGHKLGIEAVIVGRKSNNPARYLKPDLDKFKPVNVLEENRDAMPIRFGSPLYSKLQKKYWELPQIKACPFIIAVADFHDDQSMTWSSTALINYLYGIRSKHHYDQNGKLIIEPMQIVTHKVGSKEIPSGFFFQSDTENVSAVMFSASGTISKFNRMGRQAGFKHPDVRMFRFGAFHDHNDNASLPKMFRYEVDESCSETWAEGMSLFHNPNAKHPVPQELFPSIAQHRFDNGRIVSLLPDFHPYSSITMNMEIRRDGS